MQKTEFEDITSSYTYPRADWASCQLEIDGKICKEPHGKGWIMMRRDGVEGYIGGDCADSHFETNDIRAPSREQSVTGRPKTYRGDSAYCSKIGTPCVSESSKFMGAITC